MCYNTTPDGYYLDNDNYIYKKCFETCNKCLIGGNISNHNCLECKNNYTFYNNSIFISNCYEICNFYYYFNETNDFNCNEYYKYS